MTFPLNRTRRRRLCLLFLVVALCWLFVSSSVARTGPSTDTTTTITTNTDNNDTPASNRQQPQTHEETQQTIQKRQQQQQQQLAMLETMNPELRKQMDTLSARIEETLSHYAKYKPPIPLMVTPKNPVILVPGIGGSTLFSNQTAIRQVWITLFGADSNMKDYMWAEYDPLSKETKSLNTQARLHTPSSNYGLDAIHNLNPDLVWPLSALTDYFGSMIKVMTKTYGYVPGSTLFGFPFDWRQSNFLKPTLDQFRDLLHRVYTVNGNKRIQIVSHSMGGLFMRAFLNTYPSEWEKYVEKWIGIATPHQGAAGLILQEILKGYNLGNYMVSQSVAHALAMRCPSVLELFPNEFFAWNPAPTISYTFKDNTNVVLDPWTYAPNITSALAKNTIVYFGQTYPQPFRFDMWQESVNARRHFSQISHVSDSVEFYNIYGTSRPTPFSIQYTEKITKDDLSDLTTAKSAFLYADGDETVPLQSSINDGFKNTKARVPVPDSHFALTVNKTVFQLVFCWLLGDCPHEVQDLVAKHTTP